MIALPDFRPGAMENWGLITYRESAMLYTEGVTSELRKQGIVVIITHELAHQVINKRKPYINLYLMFAYQLYVSNAHL